MIRKTIFYVLFVLLGMLTACTVGENTDAKLLTSTHTVVVIALQPTITPVTPTPAPPTQTPTPTPIPFTATPVFTPTATSTVTQTPSHQVNLMAVGNIMLGRSISDLITQSGPDEPFKQVSSLLKTADLTLGNLKCVLTSRGKPEPKPYNFQAQPEAARGLANAGFDVLDVANNHIIDYGVMGLTDTLAALQDNGMSSVGAGVNEKAARAPLLIARNGLRMAILAYVEVPVGSTGYDTKKWQAGAETPGVSWADLKFIQADVTAARSQADVVIVLLNMGYEDRTTVSTQQKNAARTAIDAGAALVIGAHPSLLQGTEKYKDGLIAYSLGHFVFDQLSGPSTYSAILSVKLTPKGVESFEWLPIIIDDGLPRLAKPQEEKNVLNMVSPLPTVKP